MTDELLSQAAGSGECASILSITARAAADAASGLTRGIRSRSSSSGSRRLAKGSRLSRSRTTVIELLYAFVDKVVCDG